ncbi:MAG: Mur ligase family protein, partial [Candidatus Dormibacteraceae bacterium]
MISLVASGIAALISLTWFIRFGLLAARILQIEEYEIRRLFAWSWRRLRWDRDTALACLLCLTGGIANLVLGRTNEGWLTAATWALGAVWLHVSWREPAAKKPLVFTSRMKRLLATAGLVMVIITGAVVVLLVALPAPLGSLVTAATYGVGPALDALALAAALGLMEPLELLFHRHYRRRAEATIRTFAPTTIAVAGSYGKTSTKHILAALLNPQLTVLATPKSYNTLMGVTRTINDQLRREHRIFMAEMDAYGPGEIAGICQVCPPQISIVTAVGPEHLERFGSLQAIEDALFEVIEALPTDGVSIIYAGDETSRGLAKRAAGLRRTITYAFDDQWPRADVLISELHLNGQGSSFVWRNRLTGAQQALTCRLLGRHNALNVAAALAAVECLGLPLEPSFGAVANLEPTEHRLQPMPGGAGVTVIDDSYNANQVGVHNALEVLNEMDSSPRILVTPGLVELGPQQAEENRRFGQHAAKVCDYVIVVGAWNQPDLAAGLHEGGMAEERVHMVDSLG